MRRLAAAALLAAACGSAGPAPVQPVALVKFCNLLDEGPVTMQVGPVTLSAASGECSSALNTPCTAIPAGTRPVRLSSGDRVLASYSEELVAEKEYVLGVRANPDNPQQIVSKRILLDGFRCAELDPVLLIVTGTL